MGQARVAEAIGVSESTVSRMKDADIERTAKMLAVLGLKCVPATVRCFDPGQINAILTLAKARMRDVESADALLWQDDA